MAYLEFVTLLLKYNNIINKARELIIK
jgi:hypothetical protein